MKLAGYIDKASWEKLERSGSEAIKRWINAQMDGTTVTVVLIGTETYERPWVEYEIKRTLKLDKGLLGIYIHQLEDSSGATSLKGINPFYSFTDIRNGKVYSRLSDIVSTYDWVKNDGYNNFANWVESVAREAGL